FSLAIRRPRCPTLFPYTTLFRSLCALGVPALLITLAGNQEPVARSLQDRGAGIWLGDLRELTSERLRHAVEDLAADAPGRRAMVDRKSTRLNSSHLVISYAVFCL